MQYKADSARQVGSLVGGGRYGDMQDDVDMSALATQRDLIQGGRTQEEGRRKARKAIPSSSSHQKHLVPLHLGKAVIAA
jgi:hypothetical protein